MNHGRRSARSEPAPPAGTTTIELGMVLAIIGLMSAVALPPLVRALDAIAVHSATAAIASACTVARSAAIMRAAISTVEIDGVARQVTVTVGGDTIVAHHLDEPPYRLTLTTSRAVIAYDPIGLGFGTANTTVVARQGAVADTLFVSRLGRVRR